LDFCENLEWQIKTKILLVENSKIGLFDNLRLSKIWKRGFEDKESGLPTSEERFAGGFEDRQSGFRG